ETATRHGAWWGVAVGAAVGVIFAPTVIGAAAVGGAIGAVTGHLAKGMSRSTAKELGDFIEPGHAGLLIVGETKIQAVVEKAVTRPQKRRAHERDVDRKDVDKTLQQAVNDL